MPRQQSVDPAHFRRPTNHGDQDAVWRGRAIDQRNKIAQAGARLGRVDPNKAPRRAAIGRAKMLHDGLARLILVLGGDCVLKIDRDKIGTAGGGLFKPFRAIAGYKQCAAKKTSDDSLPD